MKRSRWPDATAAHMAVQNAVRFGKLPRPKSLSCVDCGKRASEYDHAKGYAKKFRLVVDSVCHSCHGIRMNKRGERKYIRGPQHQSYVHGLSGNKRSEMNASELESVRKYHREFMRIWRRK